MKITIKLDEKKLNRLFDGISKTLKGPDGPTILRMLYGVVQRADKEKQKFDKPSHKRKKA